MGPCMFTRQLRRAALVFVLTMASGGIARADTALVAVAANFSGAAERLAPMFTAATGHDLQLTTGSTGKLYAQILEGAPFEVLLSADASTPQKLISKGKAVAGTGFTYAVGQLALYSADADRIGTEGKAALTDPGLRFIAIANPDLAPYGVAARETLQAMGIWDDVAPRIVMGQNIGQTHALVDTGAAEVGFVALSAISGPEGVAKGSHWRVPQEMFQPIRQDAVLLLAGQDNPAAVAFLAFLRSAPAIEVMAAYGYGGGQ